MRCFVVAVPLLVAASVSVGWAQSAVTKAADPLGPVRTHIKSAQPSPLRHVYRGAGKQPAVRFVSVPFAYTPSPLLHPAPYTAKTSKNKQ